MIKFILKLLGRKKKLKPLEPLKQPRDSKGRFKSKVKMRTEMIRMGH